MKSPALLASAVTILALSACATAPSDRSVTLRRGKILVSETAPAAAAAPVVSQPVAPVVVSTPPVTVATPEPVAPVVVAPAPVVVVTPPPAPVVPPAPVAVKPAFAALRTGALVNLTWTLPESTSGYRAIEIMRNTQAQPSGRSRVRAVRATVTSIEDTLPDANANYWYWIKLTHVDGTVQNLGPFATESKS